MGSTASSVQSPNSESVLSLVSASPVTLFSATYCRYCTVVKRTLDGIGTNYNTVELDKIDSNEGGQLAMGLREVTGQGTVPQARVTLKTVNDQVEPKTKYVDRSSSAGDGWAAATTSRGCITTGRSRPS